MNAIRILVIILLAAGVARLLYGMVPVIRKPHHATVSSMGFSVMAPKSVNVPLWFGLAAILGGGMLLFVPARVQLRI